MKRSFGGVWSRFLHGGVTLTVVESQLLEHLISSLPAPLRTIVEHQFEAYNLAQREIDGRALNFYRRRNGRANDMEGLPLLEMAAEEAPLVRLTAAIAGETEPVHATLTAINGRVFCMALSRAVPSDAVITVSQVKQAWRSNFHYEKPA